MAVSTKSHEVVLMMRTMAAETASWEPPAGVDYFVGIDDCSCVADAVACWQMLREPTCGPIEPIVP